MFSLILIRPLSEYFGNSVGLGSLFLTDKQPEIFMDSKLLTERASFTPI